ncbi:MAG TPA: carotenoid oxygenase family protein [Oscillatoriales cyanobacterium M4454_W2019_049]|nr:carotenoid oxygenase family protein [Oscillatoriales cyanobacterium M4454_W2019_049]
MPTAHRPTTDLPVWAKAITRTATEFPRTPLPLLCGKIPEGLRGTLYRNGPGRLERGGMRMGHWFDGDGAILAVDFTNEGATGTYRYVRTQKYREEEAAGKLLYGNYGMVAPGALWQRWSKSVGNVANTSVLALDDRLLALWEGGKPHALDLQTLETRGLDDLSALGKNGCYSAHPKRDGQTGEIFNFGVTVGRPAILNLYKSDRTGKIVQTSATPLDRMPMLHDFVLAGQYLIFFLPPIQMKLFPVLLGLSSFSDAMVWQPEWGTQILVFDRQTLELVSRGETEPWFQWHFANGYQEESGIVAIDFVRYDDWTTNQRLKEIGAGKTNTIAEGVLTQVRLDVKTGKGVISEQLSDRPGEFPSVPPSQVGREASQIYLSCHRRHADIARELYGAIACIDCHMGTWQEFDFGENRYPTEPIYAPDAFDAERGWVTTVVYDGNTDTSEVWVFAGDRLDDEPVCRLGLPQVVPMGFHGTWKPHN